MQNGWEIRWLSVIPSSVSSTKERRVMFVMQFTHEYSLLGLQINHIVYCRLNFMSFMCLKYLLQ